jgi:hypothetical protein
MRKMYKVLPHGSGQDGYSKICFVKTNNKYNDIMENNAEVNPGRKTLKEFFLSRTFLRPFIAFLVGSTAGFLYYHFVGCTSGHCAITGNPYLSTLWGGLLGFFVVNSPCARGRC